MDNLHHIFHSVFGFDNAELLVKGLIRYKCSIIDLISMPDIVIESLDNVSVPSWKIKYIKMFSEYFYHQQEYGKPLFDNWNLLTKNYFEQWISKYPLSFKIPQI